MSKHATLASSAVREGRLPPPYFPPCLVIYTHTHTELIMHVRRESVTCTDRQDIRIMSSSVLHHKRSRKDTVLQVIMCQGGCNKWCPGRHVMHRDMRSRLKAAVFLKLLHSQQRTVQQGAAAAAFETANLLHLQQF